MRGRQGRPGDRKYCFTVVYADVTPLIMPPISTNLCSLLPSLDALLFVSLDSRGGDGMFSLQQFRRALEDINVMKVPDGTVLEVGRYFRAESLKYRGCRREHRDRCDSRHRRRRCGDENTSGLNEDNGIKISYAPLLDAIFDWQSFSSSATQHKGESVHHLPIIEEERKPRNTLLRKITKANDERVTDGSEGEEEGLEEDENYVDVRRILEARAAALDVPDSLGRRPLFVAAAAGAISVAKTLVRLGAASSLAKEGTGLNAHGVAPSLLMRRMLTVEARRSLDQKLARKKGYLRGLTARGLEDSLSTDRPLEAVKTQRDEAREGQERKIRSDPGWTANTEDALWEDKSMRQIEAWISTLADGELASFNATGDILAVDSKTSLHLAASAGLPGTVQSLLARCLGAVSESGRRTCSKKSAWTKASPKPSDVYRGTMRKGSTHCFWDKVSSQQAGLPLRISSRMTDASGWSPLHACCGEILSFAHFHCAVNLLESGWDPNSRINNGKTPLHTVASAGPEAGSSSSKVRECCSNTCERSTAACGRK